jgi:DNA primase
VLFGLDKSKRPLMDQEEAVVLEGQIDLISAYEHGVKNVVAPQGTAFTAEQARLLRRFVERVILCFDSDTAGKNAVEKSLPALLAAGLEVRVARLPKGEDPDSLIRSEGVEKFQSLLSEAKDFFDHTIQMGIDESSGNFGPREKASVASRLGGYLRLLPEGALRETTTTYVASRLGVSTVSLHEAGKKHPITPSGNDDLNPALTSRSKLKASTSTEMICRLAILSPEARVWLASQSYDNLTQLDPELSLLEKIIPPLIGLEDLKPSALLSLLPLDIQSLVSGWELDRLPAEPLRSAQGAIRGLRLNILKKKQALLTLELRNPELTSQKIVALQKEILDVRALIDDLSAPAS